VISPGPSWTISNGPGATPHASASCMSITRRRSAPPRAASAPSRAWCTTRARSDARGLLAAAVALLPADGENDLPLLGTAQVAPGREAGFAEHPGGPLRLKAIAVLGIDQVALIPELVAAHVAVALRCGGACHG